MRTSSLHKEFWVGCLVLLVVGLLVVFGWLMGVVGPFHKLVRYQVLYGFAGGVEVGSPVRVSGVKVGKVEKIEFLTPEEVAKHENATLKLVVDVTAKAANVIRQDSQFYVNMAGIIGERYVEISPGGAGSPVMAPGALVRGIDPPRIDQLLSQGYGVFGKIQDFLDKNEKTMEEFMGQTTNLLADANKLLKGRDKQRVFQLIERLYDVTNDLHDFTTRMKQDRTQQAIDEMFDIIHRGHEIDKPALKKFLQEEGIRARIF